MSKTAPAAPSDPVIIVGAGIGGLAAALALRRVGVDVAVYERAPVLHEVGAGVGLWANALRVLDRLGVGDRVRRDGSPLHVAGVCSWRGTVLSRLDLRDVLPSADAANYVVHRADLHTALADALPDGLVRTGAEVVGVEQDEDGVTAAFRDRPPVRTPLLVGADGVHSAVRTALWGPSAVRYSGQTCYRGVAPFRPDDPHVLREVQGPGQRVAVCPIGPGRVYWWAALNAPPGEADDPEARRQVLEEQFAGWPYGVPEAIAATAGPVLRNDLVDRGPRVRWGRGRATLLGDAAHPMLPNLGQGACTAIEDALVLARAVARHGAAPEALRAYERERAGRTTAIVRQSWAFGMPARWRSGPAVRLREGLVRLTPGPVLARTVREHVAFDVGPLDPVGRRAAAAAG